MAQKKYKDKNTNVLKYFDTFYEVNVVFISTFQRYFTSMCLPAAGK